MYDPRRQPASCLATTALVLFALLLVVWPHSVSAGIRGTGKYSGVVIFDRWDTCLLVSGPYVTYISNHVKGDLRPYAGLAAQIDALEVFQPMNPGDALVQKYLIIGLAPEPNEPGRLDGLSMEVKDSFGDKGKPRFVVSVTNQGKSDVEVLTNELGITVLGNHKGPLSPSDDASEAVITRADLSRPREWSSTWEQGGERFHARFKVKGQQIPERFVLTPSATRNFSITFDLSPGEYQFLLGYGGGVHQERSLVSNAISFDIDRAGAAKVVK